MRCSCERNRLTALVVLPLLLSCASAPPAPGRSERFYLEGALRIEGSGPFDRRIFVVEESGVRWDLDPGVLEAELRLLDGYAVRILCSAQGRSGDHAVSAREYRIIPPEGSIAVVGEIRSEGAALAVKAGDRVHSLSGPLIEALEAHEGMRAWVWGEQARRGGAIIVAGYEVLGPTASDH